MDWFDWADDFVTRRKAQLVDAQGRWQKFSPRAQQVIRLTRDEAMRLRRQYTGTEHFLLGLIRIGQGFSCRMLNNHGLTLDVVRQQIEKHAGVGCSEPLACPFTPRMKNVLERAAEEAAGTQCPCIGTEHLCLALLAESGGLAAAIFKQNNLSIERARAELLESIGAIRGTRP